MKNIFNIRREPLIVLISIGLAIGLLITGLSWILPAFAKNLFSGAAWFWTLILIGMLLTLTGAKLAQEQHYPAVPKPVLLLAVAAAIALVYLFPELFAPGCGGMPRAFAACPAACQINTCSDWAAPGERGCNAKPPNKGCCFAYETTCDPACNEPDPTSTPTPTPTSQPPTISGSVSCSVPGSGGWCTSGATLNMSASDPQNFATTITGDIAGVAFACAGPNCSQALPAGSGAIQFQASAPSSGLSSGVGNASFAFDPTPPSATLVISGTAASNGWYKAASISTTGSDAISGISVTQVSVDGGDWQASATLVEGIHSVVGRAIDNAGNTTTTPAQTVKVDAISPTISASVTTGTLVAGWYVTDVTSAASASDATSGLALSEHRLDSGAWSPGNSLTVATEGIHNIDFRATDQAGLQSTASLSVKVDKTPPDITFTPSGTLGANGWYTSPVSLHINAIDVLSGVASTEYRVDSGRWTSGNGLTLSDGKHTVEARATDKAGNLSIVLAAETIHIQVDTIAPSLTTSLSGKLGLAGWYVSDVTFTASVSDVTSGPVLIEYRLDGGAWLSGNSLIVSSEGAHTVDFRATDQAGLRSTASLSAMVDKTPPDITFTPSGTIGANGWYTSPVSLHINAIDVLSGVASTEYRVDSGRWTSGNGLTLSDGKHTVEARATDKAGHLSIVSTAETIGIKVDTIAPSLTTSLSGKLGLAGWYVSDVTFTASASDMTSGPVLIEYRLDAGAWLSGDSLIVSSEGAHTVDFRATDQAGLRSTASLSAKVDKTPPSITFTSMGTLGANGWYTSPVSLHINAIDVLSGVASTEYRVDGGVWTPGNSLTLGDGKHTVEARATDNAGNLSVVSTTETIGIKVDTTAPLLTISLSGKLGLAGWYVSAVTVSATASDAISGIALTEYRVDNSIWISGDQVTMAADGPHTVDFRTTDQAGNQASALRSFKIDQTLPVSGFASPLEGSSGTLAQGLFSLEGQSRDATSGLAGVQISTDNGATWLDLTAALTGDWHYTWDTKPLPDGLYPVLARAHDIAGNIESTARVILLLVNHAPKVSIQESWWIWEAGSLSVRERFLPVTEIRIRIACLDGQPDVKLNFTPDTLPSALSWDRKCGQGQLATIGDHLVTLTACDRVGNCASATGTIKVPFIAPPVPTWTPTVQPSPTPVSTATARPSPTAQVTALPTVIPSPTPAPPAPAPEPAWLAWSLAILLAGLLALACASVLDPRPRALRRLAKTLEGLSRDEQA